jgi:hypothetical protein
MADTTTAQTGTGTTTADSGATTEKLDTGAATGAATTKDAATLAGGATDGTTAAKDGAAAAATKDGATTAASDGWRDRMAGENKDFRKQLERFATEADFAKAHQALQLKFSETRPVQPFPDKGTAEEQVEWRKTQGIPDKAEEYKVELPNGMVLSEGDKPVVELFKQFAHGKNMTPQALNETLAWYYETQDAIASQKLDADGEFKTKAEDALRVEWGADFRANLNAANAVFDSMPAELSERIRLGRTADGTIIANDPVFLRWIANLGREINPAATVIPGGSGDAGKTVETELADIRKFARENPDKYDQDKTMQARQRELLDVQSRMKARGKAA